MRQRPASPARRSAGAAGSDGFPPLSISLPHFTCDGSDRAFRQLLYALIKLSTLMVRNRQHFAAYIGVTDPQYTMITLIAENPGITVGRLAEQLSVSSQFVTIEIGKLIKKAIVDKRPNLQDRRSIVLYLTERGREMLREVAPLRRRTNDLMFRSLSAERAKLLEEIVATLIADGSSALHELEAPHLRNRPGNPR
jgi:DNA-binding MarR family transcriptional regulator